METGTTTMKVFDEDKEEMTRVYGGPTHKAFQKLLKNNCTHPDKYKTYTTAIIPGAGNDAVVDPALGGNLQVAGFHCSACNSYIFPAKVVNPRRDGSDE